MCERRGLTNRERRRADFFFCCLLILHHSRPATCSFFPFLGTLSQFNFSLLIYYFSSSLSPFFSSYFFLRYFNSISIFFSPVGIRVFHKMILMKRTTCLSLSFFVLILILCARQVVPVIRSFSFYFSPQSGEQKI